MLKKISSTFLIKLLVGLINLAVLLISAKHLGSAVVGQLSLLVLNISLVQIVSEVYTGSALVFFIPNYALRSLYKQGLSWILQSVLCSHLLFFLFEIGALQITFHSICLSLLLITHSFNMVILLAKQKIKPYNLLMALQSVLLLFFVFLFVYVGQLKSMLSYLLALYGSYGITLLFSSKLVIRLVRVDTNKVVLPMFQILKKGVTNQLGNLAHTLSNRYNYYVLGSVALVGVYANSTSLIESVWIIGGSAAAIVLSRIANSTTNANNGEMVLGIAKLSFFLSVGCVVLLYLLPNSLFVYLLGTDFERAKTYMLYLSPGIIAIGFSTVISHYFSGIGEQRVQLVANVLGLLSTLSLSHYFINAYGVIGACYTASIAYVIQSTVILCVFVKQQKFTWMQLFQIKHMHPKSLNHFK